MQMGTDLKEVCLRNPGDPGSCEGRPTYHFEAKLRLSGGSHIGSTQEGAVILLCSSNGIEKS